MEHTNCGGSRSSPPKLTAQQRQEVAFLFYDNYGKPLLKQGHLQALGFARRNGFKSQLAKEIFANEALHEGVYAFIRAYITETIEKPENYFRRLLYRACIALSQRTRKTQHLLQDYALFFKQQGLTKIEDATDLILQTEKQKKIEELWRVIRRIIGNDETIKILRWRSENRTFEEIACSLNKKTRTVRKRHDRAILKLRENMNPNDWSILQN